MTIQVKLVLTERAISHLHVFAFISRQEMIKVIVRQGLFEFSDYSIVFPFKENI